jgi:hypothetical protein
MRKSRVLLAGVAVAAAAAATSAFTASNTLPADSVVGYGELHVTGATITNVHYVPNATDATNIDAVEFTSSTDVTGQTAVMTLKNTVLAVETPTANSPYSCSVKTAWAAGSMVLTCDTSAHTLTFADFDLVGLSITQ